MVTFPSSSRLQIFALCLISIAFSAYAADNPNGRNTTQNLAKSGAQVERHAEKVELSQDRVAVVLNGVISGYQTADYLVDGHAGQILTISFLSSNIASYFNVI